MSQKTLLGHLGLKVERYHWNFPEEKTYPCGETRHLIQSRQKKANLQKAFHTLISDEQKECFERGLWHILYSVSDYHELCKALKTIARKTGFTLEEQLLFVEAFSSCPPFKKRLRSLQQKSHHQIIAFDAHRKILARRIHRFHNKDPH